MKKLIIVLSLFFGLISTNCLAKEWEKFKWLESKTEWDTIDKTLFTSYSIATIIDCFQTRYIFDHTNKFHERNDVIVYTVNKWGRGTIPIYFILLNLSVYYIADNLKTVYIPIGEYTFKVPLRKAFLITMNCYQYDLINRNHKIGIKIKF